MFRLFRFFLSMAVVAGIVWVAFKKPIGGKTVVERVKEFVVTHKTEDLLRGAKEKAAGLGEKAGDLADRAGDLAGRLKDRAAGERATPAPDAGAAIAEQPPMEDVTAKDRDEVTQLIERARKSKAPPAARKPAAQ